MPDDDIRMEGQVRSDVPPSTDRSPMPEAYGSELDESERAEYETIKRKFLDQDGYEDGMDVHQLCLLMLLQNKLRPNIQDARQERRFGEFSKQISDIIAKLEKRKLTRGSEDTIPKMFERYAAESRVFIKKHIGEFSFRCKGCNTVVATDGLPHWAIQFELDESGEVTYPRWSPEVLRLYNDGVIPMHLAAYVLRTSPKALIHTAQVRDEQIRECNEMLEESELQKLLRRDIEEFEDAERQRPAV